MNRSQRLILLSLLVVILAAAPALAQTRWLVQFSSGTGFYINRAGHLITNAHVVQSCESITVRTPEGMLPATITARDDARDLAVLKTDIPPDAIAPLRWNIAALRPGDGVELYGFPGEAGANGTAQYSRTTVTGLTGPTGEPQWLQLKSVAQQGNSGGPVLDSSGNVIAVVAGRAETYRTPTATGATPQLVGTADIAITLSALKEFLHQHSIPFYESSSGLVAYSDNMIQYNARKFIAQIQCVHSRTLQ